LAKSPSQKPVIIWLLTGCVLILCMVMIGGITRLTDSGLSMVDWNLFMGSVPPTSEKAWQIKFEQYQQYPEYQKVNFDFSVEDFKSIFWWEYIHRMWGRMMGLVFVLPFIVFILQRRITKGPLMRNCLIILGGGTLVGGIGWFMVVSGLKDDPDVSHYRLAVHLGTAFSLAALVFWTSLNLIFKGKSVDGGSLSNSLKVLLFLVFSQIVYGAFVAGLDAGKIYPHFPKMEPNSWVAGILFEQAQPAWLNFFEGQAGVQFVHRYLAYIVAAMVLFVWMKGRKLAVSRAQRNGLHFVLALVIIQFLLGVCTLVMQVPVALGVAHQLGAFILFLSVVFLLHRFQNRSTAVFA